MEAARVVQAIPGLAQASSAVPDKRPLFILLDGTWAEAGKMFRKSPYLDGFPMLSLNPDQPSRYKLRRSQRDDLHCTSEVAALCLELASEPRAAQTLAAYLDVFVHHYLQAKNQSPVDLESEAHQRLRELRTLGPIVGQAADCK
ncbi:MAG: hypothetical protein H6R17_3724 [Proteobacteria bacterium]|nr:hypothetical protein [Pseudomonadota bacterium]